ncbi:MULTISPECIES: hypothetical protein [unclassified Meridianimarinicoccus]|uniref:hypothetical protein n=1 Tax=unclassified Meridianimarinicoccus TaxID=2923344 RepID=UPI001865A9B6|nr:hypothetical protein [Fluviibacterium sp. MJW13]
MTIAAFTSFSLNYFGRAKTWADSVRRVHPDWKLVAVLVDEAPEGFDMAPIAAAFDEVLTPDRFMDEDHRPWLFGHDIVEACTAVKGAALRHLLDDPAHKKVLYFDPDTAVFSPLDPLIDRLDDCNIILTPHQVEPDETPLGISDNEITSLHYGTYNLGFIAVANTAESRRFAAWWEARLHDWCHDRLDVGLFVDQKWCNLVPCFFDGVVTWRDPGYNVASWNISRRDIRFDDDGALLSNDRPLTFFHFTKLGPVGDIMTQRYAGSDSDVYELWAWYKMAVEANEPEGLPEKWWKYAQFSDGEKIPKPARVLYRDRPDLRDTFPDPFDSDGDSYSAWLRQNTDLMNA